MTTFECPHCGTTQRVISARAEVSHYCVKNGNKRTLFVAKELEEAAAK